jgi:hypothetical protein
MSASFWVSLVLWFVSILELLCDHKDTIADFRTTKVSAEKRKHFAKLIAMWVLFVGSLVLIILTGKESIASDRAAAQADPLSKPLATASAYARIVTSQNPRPAEFFSIPPDDPFGWRAGITFIVGDSLNETNSILTLNAERRDVAAWNMGSTTNREWRIWFKEDFLILLAPIEKLLSASSMRLIRWF